MCHRRKTIHSMWLISEMGGTGTRFDKISLGHCITK